MDDGRTRPNVFEAWELPRLMYYFLFEYLVVCDISSGIMLTTIFYIRICDGIRHFEHLQHLINWESSHTNLYL